MTPARNARACSVYPCPELAEVKGKCRAHASEADAERNARRARSLAVYRSKRWRVLRRAVLTDRPWCEWPACGQAATDVDHIKTIDEHPDLAFDEANLQPLCHPHHSEKTRTIDQPRSAR